MTTSNMVCAVVWLVFGCLRLCGVGREGWEGRKKKEGQEELPGGKCYRVMTRASESYKHNIHPSTQIH